jgi:hypothetical protein
MTPSAGDSFCQHCLAILKTLNVGRNLVLIQKELPSIKPHKNLEIREDLWMRKKESLNRPNNLLVERPMKPNSSLKKKLNKINKKHRKRLNQQPLRSGQHFQEQNNMLLIKPKL